MMKSECAFGESHRLVTSVGAGRPRQTEQEALQTSIQAHTDRPHSAALSHWPSAPAYLAGPELALGGLQAPLQGSHLVQHSPALPLAVPRALLLQRQLGLGPAQPPVHAALGCGPRPAPSGPARHTA